MVPPRQDSPLVNLSLLGGSADDARGPARRESPHTSPHPLGADYRAYHTIAELFELHHNDFRHTWRTLYAAVTATPGTRSAPSPAQVNDMALRFFSSLRTHKLEEQATLFAQLATRMPVFAAGSWLMQRQQQVLAAAWQLECYYAEVAAGARTHIDRGDLVASLNNFTGMLLPHLEATEKEVSAERMCRVWTIEELARLRG